MEQFIIKLKNILVKSGLKTEKELENLSDIDIQKLIIDNFIQLKTSKLFISQEEYIYILKDQFEIIKKLVNKQNNYMLIFKFLYLMIYCD